MHTVRNRLDGGFRRLDKGSVGKALIQKRERKIYLLSDTTKSTARAMVNENSITKLGNKKMRRLFLIGALCGVMITAAFTYLFAIPANSDHWRMEIYQRGGGAYTMDMKSGRTGWKW